MTLVDLESQEPKLKPITATGKAEIAHQWERNSNVHQAEIRAWIDAKQALADGMQRAYALIFGTYCTRTMQQRIEQHPNFADICDNPIRLLEVIKELMHDAVRVHAQPQTCARTQQQGAAQW